MENVEIARVLNEYGVFRIPKGKKAEELGKEKGECIGGEKEAEDIRQAAREGCAVAEAQNALRAMSRLFELQLDKEGRHLIKALGNDSALHRGRESIL